MNQIVIIIKCISSHDQHQPMGFVSPAHGGTDLTLGVEVAEVLLLLQLALRLGGGGGLLLLQPAVLLPQGPVHVGQGLRQLPQPPLDAHPLPGRLQLPGAGVPLGLEPVHIRA